MKNLEIFLFTLFAFIAFTACETEAEKQARIFQQEANKIILTKEEFEMVKKTGKPSRDVMPLDESHEIVADDKVAGHKACESLSLDDLVALYRIGKKRDWLVEHNFDPLIHVKIASGRRDIKYEDVASYHNINYGKCYYSNGVRKKRFGLNVTHERNKQLRYTTVFEDNIEQIKTDLKNKGAKKLADGSYEYEGIPIYFTKDKGFKPLNTRTAYVVNFKSTPFKSN